MNQLAQIATSNLQLRGQDDVMTVVKASIMPPGASDQELQFYVAWCRLRQVDPVSQAFVIKQGGKLVPGVTIAGMRAIAQRTGKYGPQDGPYWMDEDNQWLDVWTDERPPIAARVGVKQTDWDNYTYGVATWREFGAAKAGQNFSPWKTQPANMLAIRAEANALRRAFPADLAGMYTKEELGEQEERVDTSTGEIIDARTEAPTPIKLSGKRMTEVQGQRIAALLGKTKIRGAEKDKVLANYAGTSDWKRMTEGGASAVIVALEHIVAEIEAKKRQAAEENDEGTDEWIPDAQTGNVLSPDDWGVIEGTVVS